MVWNWQQPDWPQFRWSAERLAKAEERFLVTGGVVEGVTRHLSDDDQNLLLVESLRDEGITTSEIEGEVLDRRSVQSSVQRELGLAADDRRASPAEQGVAQMLVDLYRTAADPLSDDMLFAWHEMLMRGRRDLHIVGGYRTLGEPMQIVSGRLNEPTVYFVAPPSARVAGEMDAFVHWFNRSHPSESDALPALTRAAVAHLYFESIHPFEDGNGRIGRAISEKALAQGLVRPTVIALAATILKRRRAYYDMLAASNQENAIDDWVAWFAGIILEAQQRTQAKVEFLIDKTKLLDRLRDDLNDRQRTVLLRVLREGPDGFTGGLSAGNYVTIAKTSPATATRDLADLVEKGALTRTGERRHARYHLAIPLRPVSAVTVDGAGNIVEAS